MNFLDRILKLNRGYIYLLIALAVAIPLLHPIKLPLKTIGEATKGVYQAMEALPPGSRILVSMDFDPASKPECYPMAQAVIRHAFAKNHKVYVTGLWETGISMTEQLLSRLGKEANKKYGTDYLYLGWSVGGYLVVMNMSQEIKQAFPRDYYRTPLDDYKKLPLMEGVKTLRDFQFVFSASAGLPGIEDWLTYGQGKCKFKMGGGCTGVSAPGLMPFVGSGQLCGLLGGMLGAAEYEILINRPDKGVGGMDAQSTGHFLIIGLIVIANIAFFLRRKEGGKS